MKIVKKNSFWLLSMFDEFFFENRLELINYERFSIFLVNIKEDLLIFVIELVVFGLKKEDIVIEVDKDLFKIFLKNILEEENVEENDGVIYICKEFNFIKFECLFIFLELVKMDEI